MKKTSVLIGVIVLCISFLLTACSEPSHDNVWNVTWDVTIISNGNEYEGFSRRFMFRSRREVSGGIPRRPEDIADELTPFPLGEDFEIVIEGERQGRPRYYFSKLVDGEWTRVLMVRTGNHHYDEEIFLTHGLLHSEEWEQVYNESFLDLLEPGEYILEVAVSWGNSRSSFHGQHFFRLIK